MGYLVSRRWELIFSVDVKILKIKYLVVEDHMIKVKQN